MASGRPGSGCGFGPGIAAGGQRPVAPAPADPAGAAGGGDRHRPADPVHHRADRCDPGGAKQSPRPLCSLRPGLRPGGRDRDPVRQRPPRRLFRRRPGGVRRQHRLRGAALCGRGADGGRVVSGGGLGGAHGRRLGAVGDGDGRGRQPDGDPGDLVRRSGRLPPGGGGRLGEQLGRRDRPLHQPDPAHHSPSRRAPGPGGRGAGGLSQRRGGAAVVVPAAGGGGPVAQAGLRPDVPDGGGLYARHSSGRGSGTPGRGENHRRPRPVLLVSALRRPERRRKAAQGVGAGPEIRLPQLAAGGAMSVSGGRAHEENPQSAPELSFRGAAVWKRLTSSART